MAAKSRESLGKISRENREKGVFFVISNGNQYARGFRNEHRFPLVLWEWGPGDLTLSVQTDEPDIRILILKRVMPLANE